MSSYLQVLSFLVSFLFGVFFYLLSRYNKYILKSKNVFIKYLVTLVFVIDMVILYVYFMYKINYGNIHKYFVLLVIIGYIFMHKFYNKCKHYVKRIKIFK